MGERILIVQLADIGDLILATPALAALREARPDAHLTLLIAQHAAPVVNGAGLVDEIITFDKNTFNGTRAFFHPANLRRLLALRRTAADAIVFFHHFTFLGGTLKFALLAFASGAGRRIGLQNGKGWFLNETVPDDGFGGRRPGKTTAARHQVQYWLEVVGLLGADTSPRPAQVGVDPTFSLPPAQNVRLRIVIHPGGGGYNVARRWSPGAFARVADALYQRFDAQIILVGGANDNTAEVKAGMTHAPLDLSGQTTLPQLTRLLQMCDLFIGAESGVMHLAAAAGARVIAIFGPGNPDAWGPWSPRGQVRVLRSAPVCSPCSYVGHDLGLREGCAARTCLKMVTPDDVLRTAAAFLETDVFMNEAGDSFEILASRSPDPARLSILGIPVDHITYVQWLDQIQGWVSAGQPARQVCTVNPEFVMIAQRDPLFRFILRRAALCVADGIGLLWAAGWIGRPLPERVTGSDGLPLIAERAAHAGWRLFLLGAAPGIAQKAADALCLRYPGLQIAGVYSGSPAADEEDEIVARINASGAHLLFVAYGAPNQDKWIARNLPRLNVAMAMGVGGAFDFVAGVVPRAPVWMRRAGLEWLYRLYLQPRRIGRMLRLPRFVLAVLLRERRAGR